MVAHTATTPHGTPLGGTALQSGGSAPRTTDPLRVSAPLAPSSLHRTPSTSPSDVWVPSTTLSSLLLAPTLTDEILDDLAVPQFSLAIVAQKHGLTLSGMLTWLNLPKTREVLALRESAAYAHARHVAALNMEQAVQTVCSIVREHNTSRPQREAHDRKLPGFAHRASTNARKAAWLLLQFARIVPVNEADLRRARGASRVACLLEEQACSESVRSTRDGAARRPTSAHGSSATDPLRVSAPPVSLHSHRTPSVSDRTSSSSDSPLPSQPVHPAGALPDLPLASSPQDDANSPRVACLLGEQACSDEHPSSSATDIPHGCASAAMPPDQPDSSPSPVAAVEGVPLGPSAPFPSFPPRPSAALRVESNLYPSAASTSSSRAPPAPALA